MQSRRGVGRRKQRLSRRAGVVGLSLSLGTVELLSVTPRHSFLLAQGASYRICGCPEKEQEALHARGESRLSSAAPAFGTGPADVELVLAATFECQDGCRRRFSCVSTRKSRRHKPGITAVDTLGAQGQI